MIYFDCAATSLQKPKAVNYAVNRAMTVMASPGRGCHKPAMLAADTVLNCRVLLASYFNVADPENVIFTFNATHGLNIAINSIVSERDKVVISGYEHNSVTRPLKELKADVIIAASPLFDQPSAVEAFRKALPNAKCAVCTHVSNAFGYILPIWEISALCREYGYGDVYFYGIDEAKGERLAAQKATWGTVQDAGGKTFVACYYGTFEAMGPLLNCAVLAHRPDPEEAAKWHGVGSEAFTYAYPQVGVEEPETYRRNFGLVLWKAGFDGAMDYAYQHGFGHVWNDFDSSNYRDHNFTYPTVNGVVGTLAWDGFREAVDDVRYVTTLEAAIKASDDADAAKQAQEWLDALEPDTADLYETRARMVEWIGRLE